MKGIEEIAATLENGVKEVFTSEEYKAYLEFIGKFHHYSVNNTILIYLQNPEARLVAGYKAWQTKFNRNVRKGEKAITILAPIPHKFKKVVENENGEEEEKEIRYTSYRPAYVFDISQTDGDEIPSISQELDGEVDNYKTLFDTLIGISPVRVDFEKMGEDVKGYYSRTENRIALKEGMSQAQTIKTLVHEISHALLHADSEDDRNTKEVQAESVAYIVCTGLGLDTSDYSFGYVAGWSSGRETKELTASIEVIKSTATKILDDIKAA